MFYKTLRNIIRLTIILPLLILLISCDLFNRDDEKDKIITGGGTGYSYTLADSSLNAPAGRFLTRVYSGPSRTYSSSLSGSGSLINGNSVTITGLTSEEVPYLVFIWIDEDGDGVYGDYYRGTVNTIDIISADAEIEMSGTLGTIDFKPIIISIDADKAGLDYDCYCFIDIDGDTARNSGDYEGSAINVEADNSTVNITMTGI